MGNSPSFLCPIAALENQSGKASERCLSSQKIIYSLDMMRPSSSSILPRHGAVVIPKSQRKHLDASAIASVSLKPRLTSVYPFRSETGIQVSFTLVVFSVLSSPDNSRLSVLGAVIHPSPPKYLSIDFAAFFPCAIVFITILGPETHSPPANIENQHLKLVHRAES